MGMRIFALVFFFVTSSYAQTFHKIITYHKIEKVDSLDIINKDLLMERDIVVDVDGKITVYPLPKQTFKDCEDCLSTIPSEVFSILQAHKEMVGGGE